MATSRASEMLIAIWSFCEPEDREAFISYLAISGYLSNLRQESNAGTGTGGGDVDRSAERASSAVEVGATNSPERAHEKRVSGLSAAHADDAKSDSDRNPVDGALVTAGETALNSPSDDDAFSEVKGAARPENAAGVEPSSSDTPSASRTADPEAVPSLPTASGTYSNPQPSSSQAADRPAPTSSPVSAKAGDVPPPASPATNSKPDCLDPEHCSVPFTSALCARCNDARMKRRSAE